MADDTKSIFDMSDEEISKLDPSTLSFNSDADNAANEEVDTADQGDHDLDDKNPADAGDDEQVDPGTPDEDGDESKEEVKNADSSSDAGSAVNEDGAGKEKPLPSDKVDESKGTKTEVPADAGTTIDYKAEYERLTGKIKANGREFQVANVDDAISLMQMGIGFNKKMAALKPNLKIVKFLENNGLLDEGKLSFLVDLHKGDPAAINKLVMDSKIDPLDLTAEKASEYRPGNYSVDERELELDNVVSGIQDSPHFARTLEVVSQKWDKSSREIIVDNPVVLEVINGHIENGVYDIIANEIERERTLGRLKGLSDIAAYQQVGDAIEARGGFAHLSLKGTQTQSAPVVVEPKPAKVDDPKLKDKRRAASSTKTTVPNSKAKVDFNLLGLSDEDFVKQINPKYL